MSDSYSSEEPCPVCGKGKTKTVKLDDTLKDGNGGSFEINDLEIDVCDYCGERIFNMAAVRKARKILGEPLEISLRLRPDLHAALAKRARKSRHSITAEAYQVLEHGLQHSS